MTATIVTIELAEEYIRTNNSLWLLHIVTIELAEEYVRTNNSLWLLL